MNASWYRLSVSLDEVSEAKGEMRLSMYRVHVDTVSEEEVAQVGGVSGEAIRLQYGESLQDVKS